MFSAAVKQNLHNRMIAAVPVIIPLDIINYGNKKKQAINIKKGKVCIFSYSLS